MSENDPKERWRPFFHKETLDMISKRMCVVGALLMFVIAILALSLTLIFVSRNRDAETQAPFARPDWASLPVWQKVGERVTELPCPGRYNAGRDELQSVEIGEYTVVCITPRAVINANIGVFTTNVALYDDRLRPIGTMYFIYDDGGVRFTDYLTDPPPAIR